MWACMGKTNGKRKVLLRSITCAAARFAMPRLCVHPCVCLHASEHLYLRVRVCVCVRYGIVIRLQSLYIFKKVKVAFLSNR